MGALTVSRRPPAGHTPLFGTAGSLRGTAFCRKYGCEYEGAHESTVWRNTVFHHLKLLYDSARNPIDDDYRPGTVKAMIARNSKGQIIQAELAFFSENNRKGFDNQFDYNIAWDFMLLMVGKVKVFQDTGPAAIFAGVCVTGLDGRYMEKFMLTKGRLPDGTPYFIYCLSLAKPDAAHAFNNTIVWTVSMTDEEYRRR
ncbi:hypothetical protein [Calidithermus terrae]|uniref:hypothetical protein n=1 Tax=Calidithermus terrae TaxID=1408545 RepID=UPI0011C39B8B|nr:hypothetical protein [Calidithermus terrae]